jgi:hypothetical protein
VTKYFPAGPGSASGSRLVIAAIVFLILPAFPGHRAHGASLVGSRASLVRQRNAAARNDYSYLRVPQDVFRLVRGGELVPIRETAQYTLAGVSFPYARPAVKEFLDRLGREYRSACSERLVITSLTRPKDRQPRNASRLSVHPTGMAVDLRVSANPGSARWLGNKLLSLERANLVEATREYRPAHFHVALFPSRYSALLATTATPAPSGPPKPPVTATVRGDARALQTSRLDAIASKAFRFFLVGLGAFVLSVIALPHIKTAGSREAD